MLRRLLFVFCFGGGNLVNEMDRHREVLGAFVLDGHASGHITAVGHDAVNVEGGIVGDEWTIGGNRSHPPPFCATVGREQAGVGVKERGLHRKANRTR